jgi:rare lipoprotein A
MRAGGIGRAARILLIIGSLIPAFAAEAQSPPAEAGVLGPGAVFEGRASWYGAQFQGRRTSSGEVYDKAALTAAHRTLPFGTLLRVTNEATGASVVVRVNDRGPFVADRVIDLSEAAALLIGLVPEGTGLVRCLVLGSEDEAAFGTPGPDPGPAKPTGAATTAVVGTRTCRIQIASYRDEANAKATLERLALSGIVARIETSGDYRRVVMEAVPEAEVAALVDRLKTLGYRSLLMTWSR